MADLNIGKEDPVDPKRQGEIAIKVVKYVARKQGIRLSPDNTDELGKIAKDIGVPVEELKEFAKPIAQELLDECFA